MTDMVRKLTVEGWAIGVLFVTYVDRTMFVFWETYCQPIFMLLLRVRKSITYLILDSYPLQIMGMTVPSDSFRRPFINVPAMTTAELYRGIWHVRATLQVLTLSIQIWSTIGKARRTKRKNIIESVTGSCECERWRFW